MTTFWLLVTLGTLEASNSEGFWFIAGALWLVFFLFLATAWMKCHLNKYHNYEGLRKRMCCWFYYRYIVYLFFFIYVVWQAASVFSDKLQTLKRRDIVTDLHGHTNDKRDRILAKNRYMDGYDTQLIAYSKSFEILTLFGVGLLYPIMLGHVAMHAVKKMTFDSFVDGLKSKVQIEEDQAPKNIEVVEYN